MSKRPEGKRRWCMLRLRRHRWIRGIDRGAHRYKVCCECGRMVMTHHVSCSPACWAGLGAPPPSKPPVVNVTVACPHDHRKPVVANGLTVRLP